MIHVSIWIEDHMLPSQYFTIEIADKDSPGRQESLTFNKSQLFHRAIKSSACLSVLLRRSTWNHRKMYFRYKQGLTLIIQTYFSVGTFHSSTTT